MQPGTHTNLNLEGLSVDGADAFIDPTDYSIGATQRHEPTQPRPSQPKIAVAPQAKVPLSVAPVQVGPVSLSSAGIYWSAPSVVTPGLPYFNPKLNVKPMRPFGRMGNENLRLLFPLAIPAPITSLFGWRIHPISGTQRLHTGVDLGAPMGTPVLAAYAGRVILADMMGGYGLTVALEHNQGIQQTLYAHLSEIFVRPGEMVQQGAAIGRVGSTGASTGPHLHFEARQMLPDGTWVAVDAAEQLQVALGDLVKSLQVAQRPQTTAMRPKPGGQ
jgi:murein DD-endopeptidase MepM/ murein hydrolase activator NlpD